jgi:hypothetical protein
MASRHGFVRPLAAVLVGFAAGIVFAGRAAGADTLRRCEDGNGNITYSNQACPIGTAHERPVEIRPAVELPQGGGAKATSAGVLKLPDAPTAAVVPTEKSPVDKSEQNKANIARCDDLVRRIEYGQQDMLAASASERASAELNLRRLQDEYQANCSKH